MIRELLTHPQEIAWLPWAVQYFFFIGLASTAAFIAIGIRLLSKGQYKKTELITLALACTAGIVGPIALVADLQQPGRFLNFYFNITPWSWMWLGALLVPLFVVCVLLQFILVLRENTEQEKTFKLLRFIHWGNYNETKILPALSIILGVATFGILLYTGKEVNVVRAQPLWHTGWLPWALFFTAFQAVPMLVRTWKNWANVQENSTFLSKIQLLGLIGVAICLIGWALADNPAGEAFRSLKDQGSVWFTIGFGLIVYFVCLVLYSLITFNNENKVKSWLTHLVLALMSLSLAWTIRWAILMQTQTLPKYNVIINPYHLSWGYDGALGIISIFGLWLTLLIVFWSLLNDRWFTFKGVQNG